MSECNMCGGSGEIEADIGVERQTVGCPACIEHQLTETINELRKENTELKWDGALNAAEETIGEYRKSLNALSQALGNPALEPAEGESLSDALVNYVIERITNDFDIDNMKYRAHYHKKLVECILKK